MNAGLLTTLIIFLTIVCSYPVKSLSVLSTKHLFISIDITDTSLARKFWDEGNDLLKGLNYDSAIVYLEKAKMIYEKENLWENHFDCLNIIASVLREKGEIDSSIVVLENVLDTAKEKLGNENITYAKMKNLLGISYSIKSDNQKALEYANESLAIQLQNKNNEEAADTYYLLGIIYFNKGEFDNSIKNLNLSLKNSDEEKQKTLISNIYNSMGQAYQQKGDPDKAIEYYKNSLELKIKESGESDRELAAVYNNLAVLYFYMEDNDTAIEYYLKALSINLKIREPDNIDIGIEYNNISMAYRVNGNYSEALKYGEQAKNILIEKLGERHPTVGAIINNTGRTYSDLKEFDKAIESYKSALSIWEEKYGDIHPYTAQAYFNIGEAFANKGDYNSAIEMLNKSLSTRLFVFGEKHPKVSESYERLGQVYLKMQDYDSALYSYQKSIITLTEGFEDSSIYTNPEPDKILWNNDLLNSLILKGGAFELRYSQSKDLNDLLSSYSCFELASQLVDKVRHSFKAEGSKLSFSAKTFLLYEKGINGSLKLFDLTKDDNYKKTAFKFCEESKAALLSDALSEVKARNFSGIPDSLLVKEKNLRVDLVYFETQLLNEKQRKESSQEKIKELEDKYFALNQQYLFLLENFEKNYPSYYQLKYKGKDVSVESLQKMLDDESAIIEYFLSDTTLYTFILSSDNLDISTVKLDKPLSETVIQLRQSLQNLDFENYISSSSSLYKILIKPVEKKISGKENLFIIPDGIIYYLPFEALLFENVDINNPDFSELPYLINSFNISYLSSSAFLQEENKNPGTQFSFAGFAPVFDDDNPNSNTKKNNIETVSQLKRAVEINDKIYSELPESKIEVEGISDLFKMKNLPSSIFISEEANEEVIKSDDMNKYSFLHIATHGFINEEKPKLSGIIFTDKNNSPNEDGILYSSEIYNLKLNADLVVLSACETGLGKIVKGEGIIGLTRGFIYSGARNVLVSLWQVADKSTSELMIEFYKNVLDGKSYSSSLRTAKLKLIKDGKYSYPLEWSPFVLIGN
ncbi:MAG: CHAT domain-containing protein [Ignavibacteriales bacterium]|nr:MAG: CHAT domain-containing protein [Ignavibacteriales bacterium]